ncbi:hypothetical protein [Demequina sp.]|uniref:hypothetical protein n=1 Tax=Demequina sp. TaxID=2050685 RepID=UPI0025CECF20|nr:hypothetical protein [Demequina sp.]
MPPRENQLDPAHAPTPFTAAQIREATPEGWSVETRTTRDGEVVERARTVFRDVDQDEVTMERHRLDDAGVPAGEVQARRVRWLDLQRHASFPIGITTVTPERIVTAVGEGDCLRYDVRGDHGTSVFWFALDHPGMPVRFEAGPAAGREVTEVVAYGASS